MLANDFYGANAAPRVSVSFRSYILSYLYEDVDTLTDIEFPSPFGVIFSLMIQFMK